ncbi:hypothetical protein [Nocardia sp. NPDC049149]|uniref:hypothetical protein n=1 Tax=Nocardia sp. NPDC049149 TaxID=3364315 RepID=UPI003715E47A
MFDPSGAPGRYVIDAVIRAAASAVSLVRRRNTSGDTLGSRIQVVPMFRARLGGSYADFGEAAPGHDAQSRGIWFPKIGETAAMEPAGNHPNPGRLSTHDR